MGGGAPAAGPAWALPSQAGEGLATSAAAAAAAHSCHLAMVLPPGAGPAERDVRPRSRRGASASSPFRKPSESSSPTPNPAPATPARRTAHGSAPKSQSWRWETRAQDRVARGRAGRGIPIACLKDFGVPFGKSDTKKKQDKKTGHFCHKWPIRPLFRKSGQSTWKKTKAHNLRVCGIDLSILRPCLLLHTTCRVHLTSF